MSDFEKRKLESELKNFTNRNFELPRNCKTLEQTRFYLRELCAKIEDYQQRFNYVPDWAYALVAQYSQVQNRMLLAEFQRSYHLRPAA